MHYLAARKQALMKNLKDFEYIYTQHWEKLYAFSFRMTRSEHISQNIVQDIFTDLWERGDELKILSIEDYLFRAVKNQVFKEYRKKQFDTTVIDEKFEEYLIDHTAILDPDLVDKLYLLLDKLPAKRRNIIVMNKLEQMDIQHIAAKLNISKQTVKNQISSALKQLRLKAADLLSLIIPVLLISSLYFTIT